MNKEWWLVEAGEYVLGTLRGPERELFEKLLRSDPDAQYLVRYWEAWFAELESISATGTDTPITLPQVVWTNIESRINHDVQQRTESASSNALDEINSTHRIEKVTDPSVKSLKRRLQWWETVGALSMAACFALITVLVVQWSNLMPVTNKNSSTASVSSAFTIVSVLSADDGTQLWAIIADESSGKIRAVALEPPEEQPTQSHQLWVVLPNNEGVESIGLLPYENGSVEIFEINSAEALIKLKSGEAFAISVEPAGGTSSPTPSGPVISSQAYTRVIEPL